LKKEIGGSMSTDQITTFDIEREKLEIERRKIELEQEKIKIERSKARWTAISIIVPLIVAAITVIFGLWNQTKQARIQAEIQAQQARNEFELKAAEMILKTETPLEAHTKARALAEMFPDRLPRDFASSFDPAVYSTNPKVTKNESKTSRGWLKVLYIDEPFWWEKQLNWEEVLGQTETPSPRYTPLRQEVVLAQERALLAERRALLEERLWLGKEKASREKEVQEYYIPPNHISYPSTVEDTPRKKHTTVSGIGKLLMILKRVSL